jgi:hypothetical protein
MRHLLKFVLNMHLELNDSVGIGGVFDLLSNFAGFGVETSFEETLGVIELVL